MPSIYTHNYFAKDVYKSIEKEKIHKINNQSIYLVFAQSFDNLFYYDFYKLGYGKNIRHLGHYAHTHNVWEYFKNMITYIKENELYDDENLGYLYGSLTHYALDSTCHPYIHYISGRFNRNDYKNTKKYRGNHAINEIMIDSFYYYKNNSKKYYSYKLYKDIIPKLIFSNNIKNTINHTFKNTFNISNIGQIYNKSYNQSYLAYKYLMFDRTGMKKVSYKLFDLIVFHKPFKAYSYSHHVTKIKNEILNINHDLWLHPITGEEHNESFEDLYELAKKKCIKMIKKCNDYFNNKCSIKELEKVIGNISYSSGLECDIRLEFKYFKN